MRVNGLVGVCIATLFAAASGVVSDPAAARETAGEASKDPVERCREACDHAYDLCCKLCDTKSCYETCMDVYSKCLKDCNK